MSDAEPGEQCKELRSRSSKGLKNGKAIVTCTIAIYLEKL